MKDIERLRLSLAAAARPRADDVPKGRQSLLVLAAGVSDERAPIYLKLLLDAGLSAELPGEARSVLFHTSLTPAAAQLLLARGAKRDVHDTDSEAGDSSPVTLQTKGCR